MDYEVRISKTVRRQLDNTVDYIAAEYGSPSVLRALLDEFAGALTALQKSPLAYPIDWALSNETDSEIRKIRVKNYLLRYEVDESEHAIWVHSFLHERQDVSRRFRLDYRAES